MAGRSELRHRTDAVAAHGRPPHAVFLVGFMGAGKTTVGKCLAQRLGWRFVDLDEVIVQRRGRPIAAIFEQLGEAEFRKFERRELTSLLAEISPQFPTVVALGGGAYVDPEIASRIESAGHPAVFLDAPAEVLWRRSQQEGVERPLRQHEEQFGELYASRQLHYRKAMLQVDTSGHDVEGVVCVIMSGLQLKPGPQLEQGE